MDALQQKTRRGGGRKTQTLMAYCVPLSIVYLLLALMLADGDAASLACV